MCDAGAEGVLPREQLQDSSSQDFVPAAGPVPTGRMCHSQPCPVSRPWPLNDSRTNGEAENLGTAARMTETSAHGSPDRERAGDAQPQAAVAGEQIALTEREPDTHISTAKEQTAGSELPSSAGLGPNLDARKEAHSDRLAQLNGQQNSLDSAAGACQYAAAADAAQGAGDAPSAGDNVGPSQTGATLDNVHSSQLNLSLGLGSQNDDILPTEAEPRSFEVTARQLATTERQLTGAFCPETQVEAAIQAGDAIMQLPAEPLALWPYTQILECPILPPAHPDASAAAVQPAAPSSQQFSGSSKALPALQASATTHLSTELQLVATAAGHEEPEQAPHPSAALACTASDMPAQEDKERSPPLRSGEPADASAAAAAAETPVEPQLGTVAEVPGSSPHTAAAASESKQADAARLLGTPEQAKGEGSSARTPASRGPTMSLGLLSEDFISESEGTQRAVLAARIIEE